MKRSFVIFFVWLSCLVVSLGAGAVAPQLKGLQWVQGGPIALKPGQVTVVEFWATWCPPCRQSIPRMNQLYQSYGKRGVQFVGISPEKRQGVKRFVGEMGESMQYPVAVDSKGRLMEQYFKLLSVNGIPHAVIVGIDGKIAWNGHPMQNLEAALDAALESVKGR